MYVIYFSLLATFFGFRAANQKGTASREQTSYGTIMQCEHRGRGNDNYCHYLFPVGDQQYESVSKASQDAAYGQTVVVYYDDQDPGISTLEDFSEQSRENEIIFYILLAVIAAFVAFAFLWDGGSNRENSDESTS
jgi:hypothetical protein